MQQTDWRNIINGLKIPTVSYNDRKGKMRKFIVTLLVGAGLASGITTSAEESTELKGAVLVINIKKLAGKFKNEANVTKWPATVGQDLVNIPSTKLTAPVNNFAGDALEAPMQVGNKPQEGFLLDIVVFDCVLNDAEIKQTAKFLQQ
jgi:CO dehydrogenase/acetyl-CoA synthase delta subunit